MITGYSTDKLMEYTQYKQVGEECHQSQPGQAHRDPASQRHKDILWRSDTQTLTQNHRRAVTWWGTHRTATQSQTLLQAKLCPSSNPRVEILTPRNSEWDCIWSQSFKGVTKVNWSPWVSPNPVWTGVLIRDDLNTDAHRGETMWTQGEDSCWEHKDRGLRRN